MMHAGETNKSIDILYYSNYSLITMSHKFKTISPTNTCNNIFTIMVSVLFQERYPTNQMYIVLAISLLTD